MNCNAVLFALLLICICQIVVTAWKHCSTVSQYLLGSCAIWFLKTYMSLEMWHFSLFSFRFFLAFKWFSVLKSVSSRSPRTKVSLSLLLFPYYSSNFPSAFASLDLTWCCRCFWNVCGNACTIWKGEGMGEEWKAVWAGRDLTSWASVIFYINKLQTYVFLVCCICDREDQDQRSVYSIKKQVTFLTVKVSSHYNHLLKEVVNLCWILQMEAYCLP